MLTQLMPKLGPLRLLTMNALFFYEFTFENVLLNELNVNGVVNVNANEEREKGNECEQRE